MSQNYKNTGVITERMEKVRIQRKKRELRQKLKHIFIPDNLKN